MRNNDIPKPIIKGTRPATGIPPHNNIAWLKKHHEEYKGQWVALHDGNLLGVSEDALELYKVMESSDQLSSAVFINLKLEM
jgi:hypothetical protein